jgi:hypothetical protein
MEADELTEALRGDSATGGLSALVLHGSRARAIIGRTRTGISVSSAIRTSAG